MKTRLGLMVCLIVVAALFIPGAGPVEAVSWIANGGFESGTVPWIWGPHPIITTSKPHTGLYSAQLGGADNDNDWIYQTATIPANGTLTYWWYMDTREILGGLPHDRLYVQLYDTVGTLLWTMAVHDNTMARNVWSRNTINLANYVGRTVRVRFTVLTDAALPTTFFVDDVYGGP